MTNLKTFSLFSLVFGSCFYWYSFNFLDQSVANTFHHLSHNSFYYSLFEGITLLGDGKVGVAFILLGFFMAMFTLFRNPQHKLANSLLIISLAMITAIFIESTLKYLIGRYRPELFFQQGLYGFHYFSNQFLMNSSPSGHATRIFVLVTGFSLTWKRLSPLFIAIGVLVCLSRLALEFHYLSDVVFGSLLGTLITLWVARTYHTLTLSQANFHMYKSIK